MARQDPKRQRPEKGGEERKISPDLERELHPCFSPRQQRRPSEKEGATRRTATCLGAGRKKKRRRRKTKTNKTQKPQEEKKQTTQHNTTSNNATQQAMSGAKQHMEAERIRTLINTTGLSQEAARALLESHAWDINV